MATKAPAKKAARKTVKKEKKKAGAASKPAAKKSDAKPKKPPPKPPKTPPKTRGGAPDNSTTFTVRVGTGTLTMEYEGGEPQDFDMVLFVKSEEEAQRAQECIDEMAMRKLVIGIARTYVDP